ncbi:MAG: hypothetical protein QOG80_1881 [Pseudonocardiales bacterium]|jgi:secreted trypsin-like serine protease|nr:hypothetical protein [Pseudonocardiales bacterium]
MMRLNLVTATTVAVALVALTAAPAVGVADGTYAQPGQDPFAVKLTMTHIPRTDGTFYDSACSAALVSPTWIITAGHCFHDINRNPVSGAVPYPTTATLNTTDLAISPGESRAVVSVRQASGSDVALAQLSAPVTDVTPLALSSARPVKGAVLTLAGWGATSSLNPVPSTRLILGQVKISAVKPSIVSVVGYAPAKDTSACLYDSGAPYFSTPSGSRALLVSIESDGPACPHTSAETTSRVDTLVTWVRSVVLDLPT